MSELLARIERDAGLPGLAEALAAMAPSALRSVLLEATSGQAARRDPAGLLAQAGRDGTVRPEASDARVLHALDGHALDAARGFEAVELAPVAPLGTNAVLGGIAQNNVLSTVRNTEVLADPTAALALEAALRRRAGETGTVRLCAVGRVLRLQPLGDKPGYTPHFRLFGLVSAGRATAEHGFEVAALAEHVRVQLRLLAAVGLDGEVELSDTRLPRLEGMRGRAHDPVESSLVDEFPGDAPVELQRLASALPGARFDLHRPEGLGYYDGPMLRVCVTDAAGVRYAIGDGGLVDWTQRLLANRKERLVISGLGLGLLAARFPIVVP
ncbi:hypothetical protein OJ997_03865 [Solirubrobacter phytolaccae]|uniref:Uncharacterized protein n=1 Tax=Solirubrobacter phytolaccae TaxID=1404360 RepID=A0A9X3S7P5_9ACTN|nr:hypothetical protein [Solirubrobacter phytolaccae]MDA0179421.1 hypothetical protein [Solirubrobacter phytolaccae]